MAVEAIAQAAGLGAAASPVSERAVTERGKRITFRRKTGGGRHEEKELFSAPCAAGAPPHRCARSRNLRAAPAPCRPPRLTRECPKGRWHPRRKNDGARYCWCRNRPSIRRPRLGAKARHP